MKFNEFLEKQIGERSYGQISALTGIGTSHISKIMRGIMGTPKPETLKKLSIALPCSYEDLMIAAGYLKQDKLGINAKPNTIIIFDCDGQKKEFELTSEDTKIVNDILKRISKKGE